MQTVYQNAGGHTLTAIPVKPLEIYVNDSVDYVNPGDLMTGSDGSRFTISEIRHVSGRLYRVIMFPVEEAQPCNS